MSREFGVELKVFAAASLTGSYQNFGSVLSGHCIVANFYNTSNVDCYVTRDGTNDNWYIPAGGNIPIDTRILGEGLDREKVLIKSGAQLQIKQVTAAGTGNIVVHLVTIQL